MVARSGPVSAVAGRRTPIRRAAKLTIQDLGSIGEFVAAVATIATLVYLAAQVRQNTRALRSSTFQGISDQMAQNVEPIVSHGEVADLLAKGFSGLAGLNPGERIRFQSVLVMSFRRMEAVYVQAELGSISPELTRGFERSMYSMLHSRGGAEWWVTAKAPFTSSFSDHVDSWLTANHNPGVHPSMGLMLD